MNRFLGLTTEPFKVAARLTEPFPISGQMSGHGGARKYAGEERPSEVLTGKQFFGVRMLNVEMMPDGSLAATPVAGRPGFPATLTANALYMLESGPDASRPAVGDVIWVELR